MHNDMTIVYHGVFYTFYVLCFIVVLLRVIEICRTENCEVKEKALSVVQLIILCIYILMTAKLFSNLWKY